MARRAVRFSSIGAVIAWLIAGAVITVAVAWGCAAWSPFVTEVGEQEQGVRAWRMNVAAEWPQSRRAESIRRAIGFAKATQFGPGPSTIFMQEAWMSGWPILSFVGAENCGFDRWTGSATTPESVAAVRLPNWISSESRALPLMPIPLGFIVDTLFWGAIVAGATTIIRWLRARRRIARGLCPRCGYALAGAPRCAECGHALTRVAVASQGA